MTIQEYRIIKPNEYQHDGWDADTMTFIGTIAGDIIGSTHELKGTRIKTTDFELFPAGVKFTDDTVMTIAITKWLNTLNSIPDNTDGLVAIMQEVGVKYMQVGYGHSFKEWLRSDNPQP